MLTSAEEEAGVAVVSTEEEMENPDDTSSETNEESIPPPKEEITDLSDASRKDLSEEYDDETESLLPYSKLVSQVDTMQQRILEFEAMQQRFSEFEAMQRRLSDVESAQREIFDLEQKMRSNDPPGRYERFKDDKSILDDEQDNTPASTESTNVSLSVCNLIKFEETHVLILFLPHRRANLPKSSPQTMIPNLKRRTIMNGLAKCNATSSVSK